MSLLQEWGVLNQVAQYQVGDVKFGVPLSRLRWDSSDVAHYEAPLIDAFCQRLAPLTDVTLFDCGADIGTFAALVSSRSGSLGRVIAYEPNVDVREFLEPNLRHLTAPAVLVPKAVSNFDGCGRLERPAYDEHDHARFLIQGNGPVEVTTIDKMQVRGGNVAIKVDIEGGELKALQGAEQTISAAGECVVAFEASPMVAKRTGRDPVECIEFLQSVRAFHFIVAETGQELSTAGPVLRSGQKDNWNVVAWTCGNESTPNRTADLVRSEVT